MTTETNIQKTDKRPKSTALSIRDWMNQPVMQSALDAALAGYMDPKTFAAQCYLAAQDPKLAQCTPESLFRAFLECAQMGLLPGSHHKHVALIPRKGIVVAQPEWRGFKFLMERQPNIKRVHAELVHVNDRCSIHNGEVDHDYDAFDPARVFEHPDIARNAKPPRECKLRGGYLKVEYKDGTEPLYHFVRADKIHANRLCAETQMVWQKWFEEMCLKTVFRDAFSKRVVSIDPQLEERLGRADAADNAALGNNPQRVEVTQATTSTEKLAAKLAPPAKELGDGDDKLPDMGTVTDAEHEPAEPREPGGEG